MIADQPAHHQVVDRVFSSIGAWDRIGERLTRYEAIREHFPELMLRQRHGSRPFGVHYMAWRLGVWEGEQPFEVLDALLRFAAMLPGWSNERASLLTSADFGQYWSLLWQMQVARLLSTRCGSVRWLGGHGPDLHATLGGEDVHVECYSYQKKLGVIEFLRDVLWRVDPNITVSHDLWLPTTFAGSTQDFLDQALHPFLDDRFVHQVKQAAKTRSPIDLPLPPGTKNLRLSVDAGELEKCEPRLKCSSAGSPECYLEVALREAVTAKADKNLLSQFANTVVAINILGEDFQSADSSQRGLHRVPEPFLPKAVGLATISACGLDQPIATCRFGYTENPAHPGLRALGWIPSQ